MKWASIVNIQCSYAVMVSVNWLEDKKNGNYPYLNDTGWIESKGPSKGLDSVYVASC